jgi:hypothetical protein
MNFLVETNTRIGLYRQHYYMWQPDVPDGCLIVYIRVHRHGRRLILFVCYVQRVRTSHLVFYVFYVKGFLQNILLFVLIIHILFVVIPTLNLSLNHAGTLLVRYGLLTSFLGAQEYLQPIQLSIIV